MPVEGRQGPHLPSFLEQGLNSLRLPYPVACAVFAILIGQTGQFIALLLDIQNVSLALRLSFGVAFSGTIYPTLPAGIIANATFFLLLFLAPYLTRYVRIAILRAEPDLAPLQPEEGAYDQVFSLVSARSLPALIISGLFFFFSIFYLYYALLPQGVNFGIIYITYVFLASILSGLAFGTFFWVYSTSLLALYNFGKKSLNLKSYVKDRMLGLRPVGSISLALTRSYFLAVLLLALTVFISPDPESITLTLAMIILGIVLFFLPLRSCHEKLLDARSKARIEISERFISIAQASRDAVSTLDVSREVADIRSIMILRTMDEKAQSIPPWPLDTSGIRNFTVILLSVSAALISRVIISSLKI